MRNINKIIIHCSATPEGRDVKMEEVRKWHTAKGWRDIGYHYFIELDGTLRHGRAVEQIGAHCKGHNADSIGICYAGGTDDNGNPKDTMNVLQEIATVNLIRHLLDIHDGATVHGHNEFANKACPSFDVQLKFGWLW